MSKLGNERKNNLGPSQLSDVNQPLLTVNHITVGFQHNGNINKAVNDVSFQIKEGEILGMAGESGSGKTITALTIMGLLSKEASVLGGSILFDGKDLFRLKPEEFRKIKGNQISMIFQEPMTSLNPVMTVGYQTEEMLLLHENQLKQAERKRKTLAALKEAGLKDTETLYYQYPHQLSGGMRQRVMIAMAMICKPKLLIADEPTTALDVTIQAQILGLIQKMNQEYGTSVLFISHDLAVIKNTCTRAFVMQEGEIAEEGTVRDLFNGPKKAYTKKLMAAIPDLSSRKTGFPFSDPDAVQNGQAVLLSGKEKNILEVRNLHVFYEEKAKKLFSKKTRKQVVNNVSLTISQGEILGIVGESGSGKSSLAKAVVGLIDSKTGEVILNEERPQMVFQDPYGSLNPAKKVGWILEEPLKLAGGYSQRERKSKVLKILNEVGLPDEYTERYLSQLSGGQRQRVAIGASLIRNSKFIVLDEPVSALDVTVQARILELLKKLQKEYDLSYLFISHDLKVIYQMCDRVCVMYQGEIVETAFVEELFRKPVHPYSKKLLEAVL